MENKLGVRKRCIRTPAAGRQVTALHKHWRDLYAYEQLYSTLMTVGSTVLVWITSDCTVTMCKKWNKKNNRILLLVLYRVKKRGRKREVVLAGISRCPSQVCDSLMRLFCFFSVVLSSLVRPGQIFFFFLVSFSICYHICPAKIINWNGKIF